MNRQQIMEHQRREREFKETEIGAALWKFERAHEKAWIMDTQGQGSYKRLKEVWQECEAAREKLVSLLRPLAGLDV